MIKRIKQFFCRHRSVHIEPCLYDFGNRSYFWLLTCSDCDHCRTFTNPK